MRAKFDILCPCLLKGHFFQQQQQKNGIYPIYYLSNWPWEVQIALSQFRVSILQFLRQNKLHLNGGQQIAMENVFLVSASAEYYSQKLRFSAHLNDSKSSALYVLLLFFFFVLINTRYLSEELIGENSTCKKWSDGSLTVKL